MPGSPQPAGADGPISPWWNSILQAIASLQQQVSLLTQGATQNQIIDGVGNTVEVSGTNLAQTVTIGASLLSSGTQPGVQVQTGLTGAGRAGLTGLKTPTITLTKGSTSATVSSATGLSNGMAIGALSVAPGISTGYVQALTPGTTFTISGTTLTLSSPALVSGSGLFCACCLWQLLVFP